MGLEAVILRFDVAVGSGFGDDIGVEGCRRDGWFVLP